MNERELFEASILRRVKERDPERTDLAWFTAHSNTDPGRYLMGWVQSQWEGWQARAALPVPAASTDLHAQAKDLLAAAAYMEGDGVSMECVEADRIAQTLRRLAATPPSPHPSGERHVSYVCPQCHWTMERTEGVPAAPAPFAGWSRKQIVQLCEALEAIDVVNGNKAPRVAAMHLRTFAAGVTGADQPKQEQR